MSTALMQPTSNEIKHGALMHACRTGRTSRQQLAILRRLYWHGAGQGETRQALAEALQIPLSSICGRCSELADLDLIAPIGTEGKPARQVLGITAKGIRWLQAADERQQGGEGGRD
ncbi:MULTISPECIES: hypothetical protein [unclassified Halomonas]|uniref:hypothetical protein n=1 Tax=unclassified Halomonas TaxID=2609666 RepID=UPI002888DE4D|nr:MULTISPECIES: hypothetical protein [unclassified Halomonas]MDT0499689.1 hypothetical protein [Halomonas sp. PAR7]MDT0510494.1 hypothetical protein [Halomonas sp. LES1]MDT0589797.1 hypothetical protein [Halomonas sp. PAR8]